MNVTTESAEQPTNPLFRSRFLVAGTLLWGLVAVGLVALWQQKAHQEQEAAAKEAVANSDQPVTITLPMSQMAGAADNDVIDLSKLLNQARPSAEAPPVWDPQGLEDFSFTNCDGRTVTKADLLGRPWAVCFVFTKCLGPCPTVTRELRELQDRLKDHDIRLVTLTVDPVRDTPEVLLNYAKMNGADLSRWYFLTGDQTAIYGLIHRGFKMPVQELEGADRQEGFEIIHSTNVMLVNADGVVRGKFNAARDTEMAALRRALEDLSERAPSSEGRSTGTPLASGIRTP